MKLADIKGEEAFKVMGRVVSSLKMMFMDEKVQNIVNEHEKGYLMTFFEYTLDAHSKEWLDMYCALNPDKKPEDVSPLDVLVFALEFKDDEQMMSLFFSQSRTEKQKTSIGSATENIEVSEK